MLEFNISGQKMTRIDKFSPASDSVDYLTAKFNFNSSEWNGKAKTALFRLGDVVYPVLIGSNNICKVASEVLAHGNSRYFRLHGGEFQVSVLGEYNTVKITTNEITVNFKPNSYGKTQTPSEPTPGMYEQILTAYADAQTASENAEAAANAAVEECKDTVDSLANAVKGSLSGAVVRADDVSPVEHKPVVKVVCPEGVDPTTVTVTRCGKNLIPYPFNATVYDNGITFTDNKDGSITINGTNNGEGNSVFYFTKDAYTPLLKGKYIGATAVNGVNIMGVEKGGGYITLNTAFTVSENTSLRSIYLQIGKGNSTTYNNVRIYPMFEIGEVITEYEKYNGETYTPATDGVVPGLTSVSPTMTLFTDTEGITIECEYNRDTKMLLDDAKKYCDDQLNSFGSFVEAYVFTTFYVDDISSIQLSNEDIDRMVRLIQTGIMPKLMGDFNDGIIVLYPSSFGDGGWIFSTTFLNDGEVHCIQVSIDPTTGKGTFEMQ